MLNYSAGGIVSVYDHMISPGGHTDTQTHTHTDAQTKAVSRNQARTAEGRMHLV